MFGILCVFFYTFIGVLFVAIRSMWVTFHHLRFLMHHRLWLSNCFGLVQKNDIGFIRFCLVILRKILIHDFVGFYSVELSQIFIVRLLLLFLDCLQLVLQLMWSIIIRSNWYLHLLLSLWLNYITLFALWLFLHGIFAYLLFVMLRWIIHNIKSITCQGGCNQRISYWRLWLYLMLHILLVIVSLGLIDRQVLLLNLLLRLCWLCLLLLRCLRSR